MIFRCLLILVFSVILSCGAFAQRDTVWNDSARFYKRVQSFSDKRKVTQFVYRLIFRPIRSNEVEPKPAVVARPSYRSSEGKVIRHIHIETMDPFGDEGDSACHPSSFFERAGNYLHVKSFPLTIRNRLIIKENDTFDSLRVIESMRLVRSQNYIREILLVPVLVPGTDSVDIFIKTFDVWSIIADGSASKSSFNINVKERNFLGLGHEVRNSYSLDHTNGRFTNATDYYFSNIFNSYVNAVLHYDTNKQKEYNSSCSFDRPFYSIFTKWAGGVYLLDHLNKIEMMGEDSTKYWQNIRYLEQDYWLGKSWQLFRGPAEDERTTSLMLTGRMLRRNYFEKMLTELDTADLYHNEAFYLSSLGLVKRKYRQDSYIYKFGFTEDVPVGRAFTVLAGFEKAGDKSRFYYGLKTFWGNYYKWGYIGANVGCGTFYRRSPEETTIAGGIVYFTSIKKIGRWRMRQFVKPQFTIGFNRDDKSRLELNNDAGIHGFSSSGVFGTQKLLLKLQTQFYAPWNIIGFRLGPYFVCTAGMLATEQSGFRKSPLYSQFGIGFLIKNDFLVMSSFEISVAYFPYIPGVGNNIFKPNPFHTSDLGFQDSEIGKPSVVPYR